MVKRIFSTILLFFVFVFTSFTNPLNCKDIFPQEIIQILQTQGNYTSEYFLEENEKFTPIINNKIFIDEADFRTIDNVNLFIEKIYFIPANKISNSMEEIFFNFHKIETLKEVEYYSQSRKKIRLLFEDSYTVDTNKNKIPDIRPNYIANYFEVFQKDTSFGNMYYLAESRFSPNIIHFNLLSNSPLKLGIFKIIDEKSLQLTASLIKVEKGYIFYGTLRAELKDKIKIIKRNKDSMHNRLQAIYNWFEQENFNN